MSNEGRRVPIAAAGPVPCAPQTIRASLSTDPYVEQNVSAFGAHVAGTTSSIAIAMSTRLSETDNGR